MGRRAETRTQELFPGVGLRVEVSVADGQKGGVGEVEGPEIRPILSILRSLEDSCACEPKHESCRSRNNQGSPASFRRSFFLNPAHEIEFLLPSLPLRHRPCIPIRRRGSRDRGLVVGNRFENSAFVFLFHALSKCRRSFSIIRAPIFTFPCSKTRERMEPITRPRMMMPPMAKGKRRPRPRCVAGE